MWKSFYMKLLFLFCFFIFVGSYSFCAVNLDSGLQWVTINNSDNNRDNAVNGFTNNGFNVENEYFWYNLGSEYDFSDMQTTFVPKNNNGYISWNYLKTVINDFDYFLFYINTYATNTNYNKIDFYLSNNEDFSGLSYHLAITPHFSSGAFIGYVLDFTRAQNGYNVVIRNTYKYAFYNRNGLKKEINKSGQSLAKVLEFIETNVAGTTTCYYNGSSVGQFKVHYADLKGTSTLGIIKNYDQYKQVIIELNIFVNDEYKDNYGQLWWFPNGIQQSPHLHWYANRTIDAQQLILNHAYELRVSGINYDNTIYELSPYYIYFTLQGNLSPSGDLISDGFESTLDVDFMNSAYGLIDYQSGDIDNLLGLLGFYNQWNSGDNFFSGDLISGDILGFFGESSPPKNEYYGVLYNLFNDYISALRGTGHVTIPISIHGINYVIDSDDFVIPNTEVGIFAKTFIFIGFTALLIQQVYGFCLMVTALDFHGVMTAFDEKYTLFM